MSVWIKFCEGARQRVLYYVLAPLVLEAAALGLLPIPLRWSIIIPLATVVFGSALFYVFTVLLRRSTKKKPQVSIIQGWFTLPCIGPGPATGGVRSFTNNSTNRR